MKISLNLVLVLGLYIGILSAGLAGILKNTFVLSGLAFIFFSLLINLIRLRNR